MREERVKWNRDFSIKYAETQSTDKPRAQRMATQVGIGVLIFEDLQTHERQKVFLPPNCRLIVGRSPDCDIFADEPTLSMKHFALFADEAKVYIEDLGAANSVFLNGERVTAVRGSRRAMLSL